MDHLPSSLGRVGDADRPRNHAGNRQYYFYFNFGRQASPSSATTGSSPGTHRSYGDPIAAPLLPLLDDESDCSLVFGIESRLSGRDLILLAGGLFLLVKSTLEIHEKLEGEEGHGSARVTASFAAVIVQIALLDIVFSLDSVITAIGMANHVAVMATAVIIAVLVMRDDGVSRLY